MSLRDLSIAVGLSMSLMSHSHSNVAQPTAVNSLKVANQTLVERCLKNNPGLESNARKGGFIPGEMDELDRLNLHIVWVEGRIKKSTSEDESEAWHIALRNAESHKKSIMSRVSGLNPRTRLTGYGEKLGHTEVIDRLNRILGVEGKTCN